MVPNKPVRGSQPGPNHSGAPRSAPEPVLEGSNPIPESCFTDMGEGDLYRLLLRVGLTPFEALVAILQEEPHVAYRVALLAHLLSRNLSLAGLQELFVRFSIHPISLALQFQDRRRALGFLRRMELEQRYGPWIGRGGRLLIQGDPSLRRLPDALVLRGDSLVADCPRLISLGHGLTSLFGQIKIERCGSLRRLPRGLETHYLGDVLVNDCPAFEGLGPENFIRGRFEVSGCLRVSPLSTERTCHVDESISKDRTR